MTRDLVQARGTTWTRSEFEGAVSAQRDGLLREARRRLSLTDAEDAVSRTILAALSTPCWSRVLRLRPWLSAILRHEILASTPREVPLAVVHPYESVPDFADEVLKRVERIQQVQQLRTQTLALMQARQLSAREGVAILGRLHGLPDDEIAQWIDASPSSVTGLVSKATSKLKANIDE